MKETVPTAGQDPLLSARILEQASMPRVDSDNINHNKNPFDIWYDLNNLSPSTTYYYQLYAVVDGETYTSTVLSFTTPN